ncbi:hypothetical protein F7725_021303 [Dissostichus mawsoni]|uniref:Uncharacterized protein n=1 Tax=Dissostichus mawsoni TaxID=36200 RepID=A0A7J5YFS8_DISMA|nr:hypothetical protein F7725_021303 [Dissostichus mawsoni]
MVRVSSSLQRLHLLTPPSDTAGGVAPPNPYWGYLQVWSWSWSLLWRSRFSFSSEAGSWAFLALELAVVPKYPSRGAPCWATEPRLRLRALEVTSEEGEEVQKHQKTDGFNLRCVYFVCQVFVLRVSGVCTSCVRCVYFVCQVFVLRVSGVCTSCVSCVYFVCQVFVLRVSAVCTLCVRCVYFVCQVFVLRVSGVCTSCVSCVYFVCQVFVLRVSGVCTSCVRCVYFVCQVFVLRVSGVCTSCVRCVYFVCQVLYFVCQLSSEILLGIIAGGAARLGQNLRTAEQSSRALRSVSNFSERTAIRKPSENELPAEPSERAESGLSWLLHTGSAPFLLHTGSAPSPSSRGSVTPCTSNSLRKHRNSHH